jgi:myo-inositol 2-dehydrogenase / D-chiro-inositol 1-dehydrogenase
MAHCPRRDFFRAGAGLAAAGGLLPYWLTADRASAQETKSKNDRPLIGAVGVGDRGSAITHWAANFGDVAAVCDVDRKHAEKANHDFQGKPEIYEDYRKLLERKDLDVIINGTPDHWHTAVNIAALRAGKDLYTEKPLTLTIDEGIQLCKAVEETKRIVQVGTMQRSDGLFKTAVELVRNGRLGKLKQVWVALPFCNTKGGPFPTKPVPKELNWDFYQGQAPVHDYCPERTHFIFRWWYEYSGGITTDWGNHHIDIAHWGMDCELTGPRSIEARGFFPNPQDPRYFNTADRFFARLQYPKDVEMLFFVSRNRRTHPGSETKDEDGISPEEVEKLFGNDVPEELKSFNDNGIMFIGDKGRVFVNRGRVRGKPVEELKKNPLPSDAWRAYPSTDHMANFFDCVKTRKQPCTPVPVEHRTVTVCHLTNISIRLGRKIAWDPERQQIVGDAEANAMLKREQRKPYVIG